MLTRRCPTVERCVAAATLRTDRLGQSMLARAFRGKLAPTEAELTHQEGRSYEPASVLLERIGRERASAGGVQRGRRGRGAA